MIEKIKAKSLSWRFWFYEKCTVFSLRMARKYWDNTNAFNYWIKKAEKYCQKEKSILQLYT